METQAKQPARSGGSATWPERQGGAAGLGLRVALVVETEEIRKEVLDVLQEMNAGALFEVPASSSTIDVASAVDRDRPEVLFVEIGSLSKSPGEWIAEVRRGSELPLVIAIHGTPDPEEMILAMRAGAIEFLSLPLRPEFYDAVDRTSAVLEARRAAVAERGKVLGFLSAKGGCGATVIACHVAAALQQAIGKPVRTLVADLDYQATSASSVFKVNPALNASDAFEQVRRLNAIGWREIAAQVNPSLDLLAGSDGLAASVPEPWRVEAFFRFVSRTYSYVFLDLGRQLNQVNWSFLQSVEELFLVTGPDVLALYQTRAVLQTLANRGFDKSRVKLILNLNQSGPPDFWKESIEQMFELQVYFVLPNDESRSVSGSAESKLKADKPFEFPGDTEFGRHMVKLAAKIAGVTAPKGSGSSFFRKA